MNYSKSILEAICEMGQGVRDYNRGVLACIGKLDLWHAWDFARTSAESASAAFQRRLDTKHGDDELAKALDSGGEFPESAKLDAANAQLAAAWQPIQAIINEAREALYR